MAYPTDLDNFTEKTDNVDDVMAQDINELQGAIESLEAKVGADSSAVTSSHDYKIASLENGTQLHALTAKTTPADADELGLIDTEASNVLKKLTIANLKIEILKSVYPVGSIYTNATDDTSPATLLGFGTWTAFGAGRVMVGQMSTDTDFDTLEEEYGAKTVTLTSAQSGVPAHSHTTTVGNQSSNHTHDSNAHINDAIAGNFSGGTQRNAFSGPYHGHTQTGSNSANHNHSVTVNNNTTANASQAHNNVQPSIVVKMWKRTA